MLDHIEIHVSDLARSRAFYLSALAAMGYVPRKALAKGMGFGIGEPDDAGDPGGEFWIHQGTPSTPRVHVAFRARSRAEVDAFHSAALAAAAATTARPVYARNIIRTTTAPSSWTPTATTSKRCTTAPPDAPDTPYPRRPRVQG